MQILIACMCGMGVKDTLLGKKVGREIGLQNSMC